MFLDYFGPEACGILVSWPRIVPAPLTLERCKVKVKSEPLEPQPSPFMCIFNNPTSCRQFFRSLFCPSLSYQKKITHTHTHTHTIWLACQTCHSLGLGSWQVIGSRTWSAFEYNRLRTTRSNHLLTNEETGAQLRPRDRRWPGFHPGSEVLVS